MTRFVVLATALAAACAADAPAREQRIAEVLSDDNVVLAERDPELVAAKLRKMQRGPYEWLRGTASLYWRDLMEPGVAARPRTTFGDPASSRVLLIGDAHVENLGTFRATDGTMFVDWNDFDATGYGPFTGDVRRLGAALMVAARLGAPGDDAFAAELARLAATGYADQIAILAAGTRVAAVSFGVAPLFDGELAKSQKRGDDRKSVDELAPIDATGERVLALGDLEDVADDGVIEDRVVELTDDQRQLVDGAITAWAPGRLSPAAAKIKLAARRIGPGVSSYAALRIDVVLEGDTSSPDDDRIVELKETREGVIVHGVPILQGGEWPSPAARTVDTQRRLQARRDADALLGAAQLGGVSFKIRDRESYQRGIDAPDLSDLAGGTDAERDQLRDLARIYGAMLARAHGQALTSERRLGVDVIAPLLVGREAGFANEIATLATGDADQIFADYNLMKDRDLGALIALPGAL